MQLSVFGCHIIINDGTIFVQKQRIQNSVTLVTMMFFTLLKRKEGR